jgi:hypothetical protein
MIRSAFTTMALSLAALIAMFGSAFAEIAINGGSSWGGWTSKGLSNQLGVYGSGSTTDVYEVYTTIFSFNNNTVTGGAVGGGPTGGATGFGTGAFSTGAFANGNRTLGIGVRQVSGSTLPHNPTVRFDLDADSYLAATSVGGSDGRTSFTSWSEQKDFTVQFDSTASWQGSTLTMQAGNGTSNGGPNNQQQLVGGIGSGVSYDWAFRAFAQSNSYQMFFDLTAMQSLYGGSNPFGLNSFFTGIGAIGDNVRISLNGLGTNNVAFGAPTALETSPVPEQSSLIVFSVLICCTLGIAKLSKRFGYSVLAH